MGYAGETRDSSLLCTLDDVEVTSPSQIVDLADLWRELCAGTTRIAATLYTDRHSYFKLVSKHASAGESLPSMQRSVLERLLLGESQKTVAFELKRSASTVATHAQRCLSAWGLDCGSSRAPLLLITALHAFHGRTELCEGRSSLVEREGRRYRILSAPRPDACLADVLTPSQCAVARLRVEGRSLADIASVRKKSLRTIANQLASVYEALAVSCRLELVCRLLARRFQNA
jgi:DNA-binding NarL/FixJ family response regulator